MAEQQVQLPPGAVFLTTYGMLRHETHRCIMEMRSHCEKNGLFNIAWESIPGMLVDMARNQAVAKLLSQPPLQWLLFVDGDATFAPDALMRLLLFAYQQMPSADLVGAYNPLRSPPHLPTIDTGTGTWESHLPMSGPMQVMRTGSAFVLIKRHVFERLEGPWYGVRNLMRPIDALVETDNYANQKFDGHNPLADLPEWQALLKCAKEEGSTFQPRDPVSFTGEDSGLGDRMKAAGMQLWVHTDIVCGHIADHIVTALDHRTVMAENAQRRRQLVGVCR
jgi:hypothetical protein